MMQESNVRAPHSDLREGLRLSDRKATPNARRKQSPRTSSKHAIRYGWMKTNPIRAVRQSAKRERIPTPLTAGELQALFAELGLRDRTLVLLDVPTGMRRGELLAIQWRDVDFQKWTLNIRKSIWQQHLGPVKTEESEKTMPLDEEMIADLCVGALKRRTPRTTIGFSPVHACLVASHYGRRLSSATISLLRPSAQALLSTSTGTCSATHSPPCSRKTMRT
jgi:integrase